VTSERIIATSIYITSTSNSRLRRFRIIGDLEAPMSAPGTDRSQNDTPSSVFWKYLFDGFAS